MYAVIQDGGKQYKVTTGDVVHVELRDAEVGSDIAFDQVLCCGAGEDLKIGQPTLAGAKVLGKVIDTSAGPKVFAMSFKRRKDQQRRVGHRQKYLAVEITAIES